MKLIHLFSPHHRRETDGRGRPVCRESPPGVGVGHTRGRGTVHPAHPQRGAQYTGITEWNDTMIVIVLAPVVLLTRYLPYTQCTYFLLDSRGF